MRLKRVLIVCVALVSLLGLLGAHYGKSHSRQGYRYHGHAMRQGQRQYSQYRQRPMYNSSQYRGYAHRGYTGLTTYRTGRPQYSGNFRSHTGNSSFAWRGGNFRIQTGNPNYGSGYSGIPKYRGHTTYWKMRSYGYGHRPSSQWNAKRQYGNYSHYGTRYAGATSYPSYKYRYSSAYGNYRPAYQTPSYRAYQQNRPSYNNSYGTPRYRANSGYYQQRQYYQLRG